MKLSKEQKILVLLGVTFLKTNNCVQAKYFLERSQGYLDAQMLLQQIKNKCVTEKNNLD